MISIERILLKWRKGIESYNIKSFVIDEYVIFSENPNAFIAVITINY